MSVIHAIYLSIVEGLTEFLPVSSTFHLIIASEVLGIPQGKFLDTFLVIIQSGAILAVVTMYLKHIRENPSLVLKVGASFVPTAIVGFGLYEVIKRVFFHTDWLMLGAFVLVGYVFILLEYLLKKKSIPLTKSVSQMNYREAVLVGLAQSLAVIPGVSRAGIVIVTLIGMRYKREEAAMYSFYLAVPTILAASVFDALKMKNVLVGASVTPLVIGIVGSYITAYIGIRWFIGYLKTHTLTVFGWYRVFLGIILLFSL